MLPLECFEEIFEAARAGRPVVCTLFREGEAEPAVGVVKYFLQPGLFEPVTGAPITEDRDTLNGALTQWQPVPRSPFGGLHVQTAVIWIYRLKPSENPDMQPPHAWLIFTNPASSERSIRDARCADTQGHQATVVGRDNLGEVWNIHLLAFHLP